MRILQVCADRGIAPGSTKGAAQHLRGLAAGLLALGHDVTTVTARPPEGPFPAPVQPLQDLDHLTAPIDAVYERYSLGHRGGLELARRLDRPFVLEVNAPLVDETRAHRPLTLSPAGSNEVRIEAELLAAADLVVAVSTDLARWAGQFRSRPTITVGNGFEPAWFSPTTATAAGAGGGGSESPPLVFLGHPKPWHGADRLPRLLWDLEQRGRVSTLRIIGGGRGVDPILAEARLLGVADRIDVTGPLSPPRASGRLAHGLIGLAPYPRLTPFYFCPLKIIDYLAAGLPVVSTRQGDIPELVGDAGIVVDPGDDGALADAVESIMLDPDRRTAMGRAGRRRAHKDLTWTEVAARTAEAMKHLCGTHRRVRTPALR